MLKHIGKSPFINLINIECRAQATENPIIYIRNKHINIFFSERLINTNYELK
jgi:hypothetical protein